MKTKLFTIFAAAIFIAASATAQITPDPQQASACLNPPANYGTSSSQEFGLSPELVQHLGLTQGQIDTANATVFVELNYYTNQYGNRIVDCQDEINSLLYGPTPFSAQAAGSQIASLAAQLFTTQAQLDAKRQAAQTALENLLRPDQQAKLAAIINAFATAQNILNLVNEASYADLFIQTNAGSPINTTAPSVSPGAVEMVSASVTFLVGD